MGRLLLVLLLGFSTPVGADSVGLSEAEFDALTQGRTWRVYLAKNAFRLQSFLPRQRTVWKDDAGCHEGKWFQMGGMICLQEAAAGKAPHCWQVVADEGHLTAWVGGDHRFAPLRLEQHGQPLLACTEGEL